MAYHLVDVHSWIDVALQLLPRAGWSPERCNPREGYTRKLRPPAYTYDHFFPLEFPIATEHRTATGGGAVRHAPTLYVQGAVSIIGDLGVTLCALSKGHRMVYRSLYTHGRIVTKEPPLYLEEAALLHALRATHGYLRSPTDNPT